MQNTYRKLTLKEMIDLALCTPEAGVVNFNILHEALCKILEELDIQDRLTECGAVGDNFHTTVRSITVDTRDDAQSPILEVTYSFPDICQKGDFPTFTEQPIVEIEEFSGKEEVCEKSEVLPTEEEFFEQTGKRAEVVLGIPLSSTTVELSRIIEKETTEEKFSDHAKDIERLEKTSGEEDISDEHKDMQDTGTETPPDWVKDKTHDHKVSSPESEGEWENRKADLERTIKSKLSSEFETEKRRVEENHSKLKELCESLQQQTCEIEGNLSMFKANFTLLEAMVSRILNDLKNLERVKADKQDIHEVRGKQLENQIEIGKKIDAESFQVSFDDLLARICNHSQNLLSANGEINKLKEEMAEEKEKAATLKQIMESFPAELREMKAALGKMRKLFQGSRQRYETGAAAVTTCLTCGRYATLGAGDFATQEKKTQVHDHGFRYEDVVLKDVKVCNWEKFTVSDQNLLKKDLQNNKCRRKPKFISVPASYNVLGLDGTVYEHCTLEKDLKETQIYHFEETEA